MKLPSSSIRQITLCAIAAATALTLSACDSKQENAREDAVEQKADNMDNKADAVRDGAEKKADAIENSADAVRDMSPAPTP